MHKSVRYFAATEIRSLFLEYFSSNGHKLVRSSPVMPFKDPSLAFVNAGMNQFKSVFLGTKTAPYPRVVNVQKCVRVGGKHNDLDEVGRDHTHHTFFEMLGNWSFNDYYKKEACTMAWDLLTNVYKIPKERLHVTYFGGDVGLNLPADHETKDIWRSIGIPDDKIIALPMSENFWQMADTGPCGVCTEIHCDGVEIWNLVFMEFMRCGDGTLLALDKKHVDTGMGFERLVAMLQGRQSTYQTELFTPLLAHIQKIAGGAEYSGSNSSRDCAYRTLADHSRMLAITLCDGFYPHLESKVRHVLRRAKAAQEALGVNTASHLLGDLCWIVGDILGPVYPELHSNLSQVAYMINEEERDMEKQSNSAIKQWIKLCENDKNLLGLNVKDCPGILNAYLKIKEKKALPYEEAWKLCESFGVPVKMVHQLANVLGVEWDENKFQTFVNQAKAESLATVISQSKNNEMDDDVIKWLVTQPITKTRAVYKNIVKQPVKILAIVAYGLVIDRIELNDSQSVGLLLDQTNLYAEGGGQESDHGRIFFGNEIVENVTHVENIDGRIIHWISHQSPGTLKISKGDSCTIELNLDRRKNCSSNHTGIHLLQASLHQILPPLRGLITQNSSKVTHNKLGFDFSTYKQNLKLNDVENLEKLVNKIIQQDVPVRRLQVDPYDLPTLPHVTLLPGSPYLHNEVTVVEVISSLVMSREPCCGTHVERTSHLNSFVITSFKSASTGVKSVRAVTKNAAEVALKRSLDIQSSIHTLSAFVEETIANPKSDSLEECDKKITYFNKILNDEMSEDGVRWVTVQQLLTVLTNLREKIRTSARNPLRKSMTEQMTKVMADNFQERFIVYQLKAENEIDSMPLQKVTRMCPDKPCLIVKTEHGIVKARCCVPENIIKEKGFTAEKWLQYAVSELIGCSIGPPRNQNSQLVCNLKGHKLTNKQLEHLIESAKSYALKHL